MMRKLICALNASIANMTNFLRVEQFPFLVMEFVVEFYNKLGVNKIKKCITNIAIILHKI